MYKIIDIHICNNKLIKLVLVYILSEKKSMQLISGYFDLWGAWAKYLYTLVSLVVYSECREHVDLKAFGEGRFLTY